MKIHSDTLTRKDLYASLPKGNFWLASAPKGSRKRARGFVITLAHEADSNHPHHVNSGTYGAGYDHAATWDEWGVWLDRLFHLDPDMIAGPYAGVEEFIDKTTAARDMYLRWAFMQGGKRGERTAREHSAPWLVGTNGKPVHPRCYRVRRHLRAHPEHETWLGANA